ncbi:hypothetical protein A2V82_01665 [candidate division KSB1 bacterium RBG_16_48_16]|nr:MAG: hypothetical protein A2V82_01665 [candidate division KSB1 bacterium RBG_16_48_16]
MKIWHKRKDLQLGDDLFIWRYRAVSRFATKSGTWLLAGFVMGILASIFMAAVGFAEIAQKVARAAFWLVFVGGVADAFLRYVWFGVEYRINQKALINVKSLIHRRDFNDTPAGGRHLPGDQVYAIPWKEIDEIKAEDKKIVVALKENAGSFELGVSPAISYALLSDGRISKTRKLQKQGFLFSGKDAELDDETRQNIFKCYREVRRA